MASDPDATNGAPLEAVIEEPLARELEKFKGRWVAVFQKQVVAVSDSASQVRDQAEAKGFTDPLVFRVPLNPNRVAYL